jgi:hypothetical protein
MRQASKRIPESAEKTAFSGAIGVALKKKKEHDAMRMQEIDIHDYARQLLDAHGDKAVAEAAQKACALEKQGQSEQAETWRHIEAALELMRGPYES